MPYDKKTTAKYVWKRRIQIKQHLVRASGGKCCVCGYNKCIFALEFHHKDPKEKEFGLASMVSKSIDDIVSEIKKCILVCSNCHKEIHAGITDVGNPSTLDEKLFWDLRKKKSRVLDIDIKAV